MIESVAWWVPQGKVVVIASMYIGIPSTSLGSLLVQMMKLVHMYNLGPLR